MDFFEMLQPGVHYFLNVPQLGAKLSAGGLPFRPDELAQIVRTFSEIIHTLIEPRVRIADSCVRLQPRQNNRYIKWEVSPQTEITR
jgi:hypothetical protein